MKAVAILVLCLIGAATGCGRGDDTSRQTEAHFDGDQLSFGEKVSNLAKIKAYNRTYAHVRDHEVDGKRGVIGQVNEINLKLQAWVDGWKAVKDAIDAGQPGEMAQVLNVLKVKKIALSEQMEDINLRRNKIMIRIERLTDTLAKSQRIEQDLGLWDPQYQELVARNKDLIRLLEEFGADFDRQINRYYKGYDRYGALLQTQFVGRVIEQGIADSENMIRKVKKFFAEKKVFEPLVARLSRLSRLGDRSYQLGQVFAAEESAREAAEICGRYEAELGDLSGLSTYGKDSLSVIKSRCARLQALGSEIAGLSLAELRANVRTYGMTASQTALASCGDEYQPRCNLALLLSDLNAERLAKMTRDELKTIEDAWGDATAGAE